MQCGACQLTEHWQVSGLQLPSNFVAPAQMHLVQSLVCQCIKTSDVQCACGSGCSCRPVRNTVHIMTDNASSQNCHKPCGIC